MSDPRDDQRPATRRMEPLDPSAGSAHQPPTEGYPAPSPAPASGAYQDPGYRDPAPYAGTTGTGTQPAASPPPNRSRTVLLALIAGLALLVLVLAGYLVISGPGSSDSDDAAAGADSSTTAPSATTESTTSSTTTSQTTSENTRPTAAPGAVTYQFTGNGSLIGVRYRDGSGEQVVAAAGSPWSVRVTLRPSASAEVTGIVVNGAVTCNILHGEELLASSTSRGGPLSCNATVPD